MGKNNYTKKFKLQKNQFQSAESSSRCLNIFLPSNIFLFLLGLTRNNDEIILING